MESTTVLITLRKEVADDTAARAVIDAVNAKMADRPDVVVTSHFTTRQVPDP